MSPDTFSDAEITRRDFLRASAAAGIGLSLGGLGGAAQAATQESLQTPKIGGKATLAMSDGGPGETLNPFRTVNRNEFVRAYVIYDALFQLDDANIARPALALSAEPARDASVWRVKLRRDVSFHNGKRLTADDVIWSFRYALAPRNKTVQLSNVDAIRASAIRKLSAYEVLFRLDRPLGAFQEYLAASPPVYIIPSGTTSFDSAIGTGPFKLEEFAPGQRTTLARNDDYWGNVYLDELTIVPIPDPSQRMNALLAGQVDAMFGVDLVQAKAQRTNRAIRLLFSNASSQIVPIYFQIDARDFRDNRVRTALKLSVDRRQMMRNVLVGFGSIGNDVHGKGYPSYNDDLPQRRYDPERARALLKAAGKSDLRFTLATSSAAPGMLESATAWKAQAKAAGISINLVRVPADTYFSNRYLKAPIYQTAWLGREFEAWATQALFRRAPYNETHWFRSGWEAAFRRAQSIRDDARRIAAYKELQIPVWEEGGYIIWGNLPTINAVSARIRGARPWSFFNLRPHDWWVG